ncbi:ATP phosphoribosyltransferase [Spirochaeta thermophila]|uniref:ATP phosphoribosyltransferase n=1 Tax=Winmispira thermophila (strain ATCC 49972 / DSM 6192 / RI 19.B1) TaxID=665571 RepID=E0RRW6_WINT6|nr:ATP phosphoribosyltransferase [Spirochaeta thermophila]ADN01753.1 ATP phosphoribosyltransferase [Spirochaeta thermophila DSM 6192]
MSDRLTMALPKGRLLKKVQDHFGRYGIIFPDEDDRKLVIEDTSGRFTFFLVKNSDLPVYVSHGIAGLGICGEDVLTESQTDLLKLAPLPFGSTKMCLAARKDTPPPAGSGPLTIATKFPHFTRTYYHKLGVAVQVIKLAGSVELAPVLGLAPYIVDLVETGSTLKANNLYVVQELARIRVYLVANPAYYKLHYKEIEEFLEMLDIETTEPSP